MLSQKKYMIFSLLITFFFSPLFAMCSEIQFVIEPEVGYVCLGEPFFMNVSIENKSNRKMVFHITEYRFRFIVKKSNNEPLESTKYRMPSAINARRGQISYIEIEPGEIYSFKLLVSQWFVFPEPGTYTVTCMMDTVNSINDIEDEPVDFSFRQAEYKITVGPKDKERLKEICEKLTNEALNNAGKRYYGESNRARLMWGNSKQARSAQALSYVQDEIALPYMKKFFDIECEEKYNNCMGYKELPLIISYGCRRIDTPEAARVLINFWKGWKKSWGSKLVTELRIWRGKTTNPEIMDIIDKHIKEPPIYDTEKNHLFLN